MVFAQEVQVAYALQLIGSQGRVQALGLLDLLDLLEVVDLVTQGVPETIGGSLGDVFEDLVQNRSLEILEPLLGRFFRIKAEGDELVAELLT